MRATDEAFELPRRACGPARAGSIYLSLGSLGSADVDLMSRLVEVLSSTPHRYIVSKGPQHDLIELADNMWGREFLPQTSILPQVDLVITHGGNNTVTECLHFGKPMVVLPLFWDQYDNAQRVDELGFGTRLPTYEFEPSQLAGAIDALLDETSGADRRARAEAVAKRLQASPGTVNAADLIERLAREGAAPSSATDRGGRALRRGVEQRLPQVATPLHARKNREDGAALVPDVLVQGIVLRPGASAGGRTARAGRAGST